MYRLQSFQSASSRSSLEVPQATGIMLITFVVVAIAALTSAQRIPIRRTPRLYHELINTEYAGQVSIGTQSFLCVMDTSSSSLVLAGQDCTTGACASDCGAINNRVNKHAGPNAQRTTVSILDTGSATGARDTINVKITDTDGTTLEVQNQTYVLASVISRELCPLMADGVFGLGPPNSLRNAFGAPSFLDNAVSQGDIDYIFSVHHGRYENGEHFGEVIFGGSDPTYYTGDFTYVPLLEPTHTWKIPLDSMSIGDTNCSANYRPTGTSAFVDTSKSVFVGPKVLFDEVNQCLGCTSSSNGDSTVCEFSDCNSAMNLPDVIFGIGGKSFNISARYYVQQQGDKCVSGFVPSDKTDTVHLGDIFMDHYYCEFDGRPEYKRMGFARASEGL